jgi:methyl-accepting chemotaxis protein
VGELFVAERMVKDGMQTVQNVEDSMKNITNKISKTTKLVSEVSNIQSKNKLGGRRIYESIGGFLESSRLG